MTEQSHTHEWLTEAEATPIVLMEDEMSTHAEDIRNTAAIATSLRESIESLRDEDFGWPTGCWDYQQRIYLDPEEHRVWCFTHVGAGMPMRAFHRIDQAVIDIPRDALPDSVAEALLGHLDALVSTCQQYLGSRWDGSNWIGQWSEDGHDHDRYWVSPLSGIEAEIECAWQAGDWLVDGDWASWCRDHGIDPERGEEAVDELAAAMLACADEVVVGLEDVLVISAREWIDEHEAGDVG